MISLITVNYNNVKVTCELIESLKHFNRNEFELIVVDNASKEDPSSIGTQYPWVKLIRSNVNLGFAGGNNLGIKYSIGDYLFFINNDAAFNKNILPQLMNILKDDKSIGVVCPLLKYYEEPGKTQYAGFTNINKYTGRNKLITEPSGAPLLESFYAHGAAMMMRREIIDQVGLMPENYFVYYEEMDWSAQITRKGYRIVVDSSAILYHKESQTIGKLNEMKSYFMARNRLLFMRRNSNPFSLSIFWAFFLMITTPRQLLTYALARQGRNMQAHLAGIAWNIQNKKTSNVLGYKFNFLTSV